MEYHGFNIEVKDALWVSDIGAFHTFRASDYSGNEQTYQTEYGVIHYISKNEISYRSLDGDIIYSAFKYDIPSGKYLLSVKGFARVFTFREKIIEPVGCEKINIFDGFKNPREEIYDFNVAHM